MGNAVMHPFICVVRLVLERGVDVLVVGDQIHIHRRHVAADHEAQRGVARRRHAIVLAGLHERDHLVRGAGDLGVRDAAGLLLERTDPVRLGIGRPVLRVPGPDDDVQRALALADRGRTLVGR